MRYLLLPLLGVHSIMDMRPAGLAGGGLGLAVSVDGSGTMTATTAGAFAPFSVTIDGSGTMTATGG